jgi:hypothetical protein
MPRYPIRPKVLEIVKIFDSLPDSALVSYEVGAIVTSLDPKTLRKLPQLDKVRPSQKRECLTVGSLRRIGRGGETA